MRYIFLCVTATQKKNKVANSIKLTHPKSYTYTNLLTVICRSHIHRANTAEFICHRKKKPCRREISPFRYNSTSLFFASTYSSRQCLTMPELEPTEPLNLQFRECPSLRHYETHKELNQVFKVSDLLN